MPRRFHLRFSFGGQVAPRNDGRGGFTLLETVVALAIILGAIIGPVTLILRGLVVSTTPKNRLVALELAQEGIELARVIRENNILCAYLGENTKWDDNPAGGSLKGTYKLDVKDLKDDLECEDINLITPRPSGGCDVPLKLDADGTYTYTAGTPTIFSRCVEVCSPPNASPCNANKDGDIPADAQMVVSSTVSWNERAAPRNVTLRTYLYHWE